MCVCLFVLVDWALVFPDCLYFPPFPGLGKLWRGKIILALPSPLFFQCVLLANVERGLSIVYFGGTFSQTCSQVGVSGGVARGALYVLAVLGGVVSFSAEVQGNQNTGSSTLAMGCFS